MLVGKAGLGSFFNLGLLKNFQCVRMHCRSQKWAEIRYGVDKPYNITVILKIILTTGPHLVKESTKTVSETLQAGR